MSTPIAISMALTGARYSPWLKSNGKTVTPGHDFYAKNMPLTPEAIASDVTNGYRNGALFFHAHARNPKTGAQYADLGWYQSVASLVRRINPNLILSFPTSRKMEVGKEIDTKLEALHKKQGKPPGIFDRAYYELKIRGIAVEAQPDTLTTFTVPEVKILGTPKDSRGVEDVPGWSDPDVMKLYYHGLIQRTKELGVMQEIEITTMGQFDVLRQMAESGNYHMDAPIHFVILLGFSNGLPINKETYEEALRNIEDLRRGVNYPTCITVGAVIRPKEASRSFLDDLPNNIHDYYQVMEWVVDDPRVNIFRVGLEDTPELYGEQWTNPELITHVAEFFDSRGRVIEKDPNALRNILGCRNRFEEKTPEKRVQKISAPEKKAVLTKKEKKDAFNAAKYWNNNKTIKPGQFQYEALMRVTATILNIDANSTTHSLNVDKEEDSQYTVWLHERNSDNVISSFTYGKRGKIEQKQASTAF